MSARVAVALVVTLAACGPAPTVTANDVTFDVVENIVAGATLGQVSATASAGGAISYAITQQAPGMPLAIDAASGVLTVADASAFDFEQNKVITATVTATSGGVSGTAAVTVNLKNELRETTDGALVHYTLDGHALEAFADTYDGTTGAAAVADRKGKANSALQFVPAGEGRTQANFGEVAVSGGQWSVGFWMLVPDSMATGARASSAGLRVLTKRAACSVGDFFDVQYSNFEASAHRLGVEIRSDTNGLGSSPSVSFDGVPVDAWFHVAFVIDSAARKSSLYVNGELKKENVTWTAGTGAAVLSGPLGIGTSPCINGETTVGFGGAMDDLVVFGRALSADEVALLATP